MTIENPQLVSAINELGFYLPQQVQQIPNTTEAGFRVYVIDTAKHTNIEALISAIENVSITSPPFYFQDDYDMGVFFEGFSFFLPTLITQDSDAPLPLFLIQLDL
ncbi:hypothetical protein [Acinetobacter ursingii]|uniref:hypothetical protein n=1 Tax=Acinetobacter ursingii TaxID=108980 RepID=UPI00125071AC|nr:hypothetical protein [Acinetobacter ursingii]